MALPAIHSSSFGIVFFFLCISHEVHATRMMYQQSKSPVPVDLDFVYTFKSGVLGSIPGLATYFRFSFRFFKKGSRQLLAKACARSTG